MTDILDPIDVCNDNAEACNHLEHLPQCCSLQFPLDSLISWEAARPHSLHQKQLFLFRKVNELFGLLEVHGEWLLAEDVLPVAQHQFADVQVQCVDGPDVYHLCVTPSTFLNAEKFVMLLTTRWFKYDRD